MGYPNRTFRGYLTGIATLTTTGAITAGGAIESSSTVTGTRLIASTSGAVGTPAIDIVNGANHYGLYEVGGALVIAVAGAARGQASSSGLQALNGPLITPTFVEFTQTTTPSAPAAGTTRIYGVDNGGSKTQFRALFDSGAAQAMATEP